MNKELVQKGWIPDGSVEPAGMGITIHWFIDGEGHRHAVVFRPDGSYEEIRAWYEDEDKLLDQTEIANRLRLSRVTVGDYLRLGKFPKAFKMGKRWFIMAHDLEKFIRAMGR